MNTEKTGGAAFPIIQNKMTDTGFIYTVSDADGMTLLDYFAAKALPEMLYQLRTTYSSNKTFSLEDVKKAAKMSYIQATAMIEERKKYIN